MADRHRVAETPRDSTTAARFYTNAVGWPIRRPAHRSHVLVALILALATAPRHARALPDQESASANHSRKFGPGECRPVDPSYIRAADETGGQPFFLNPSETGKAFHFVRET